jgi:hypothetical protein
LAQYLKEGEFLNLKRLSNLYSFIIQKYRLEAWHKWYLPSKCKTLSSYYTTHPHPHSTPERKKERKKLD